MEKINENINKPKKKNVKFNFLKEFYKDILTSDEKNDYIDDIMNKNSIDDSSLLKNKLEEVRAKDDLFDEIELKNISIFDLRKGIAKDALKLETARQEYLEYTFSNFNLTPKQRKKLETKIKELKEYELDKLIYSEEKNDYFLRKFFSKKIGKPANFNFLDLLTKEELEERLKKYSDDDRKEIELILNNLNSGKVYDTDIRDLFTFDFFNEAEKKEILEIFIPYIHLSKAVELEILTNTEAEKKKKDILYDLLKDKKINSSQIDEIIEKASLSDIKIKSSDIFNKKESLNKIAEDVGFANIEESFNHFLDEERKKIESKGAQSFDELKIKLGEKQFEGKIDHLGDFAINGIIKQVYRDKEGNEKIGYLRIINKDDQNKKISLKPIGDNSTGKEIINFDAHSKNIELSFVDFEKNIKKSDKISFFTESDLKKKIKSGEIKAETSDLEFYTKKDLNDEEKGDELVKDLQEKYKGNLNKQLDELIQEQNTVEEEIKNIEKTLKEVKQKEQKEKLKSKLENLNIKKENLKTKIKLKQEEIGKLENDHISNKKLLEIGNKQKLLEKIDFEDTEGEKFGLTKGMFISTENGIYEIKGIDWESGEIDLLSTGKGGVKQYEKLSFEEFYQAFKKNNAKRLAKINNFDEFLKDNQQKSKLKDSWEKYEIKNGELHLKEQYLGEFDNKKTQTEYLISGTKDIIKIKNISGDKITVSYGEYKSSDKIHNEVESGAASEKDYKSFKDPDGKTIFNSIIYLDKTEYTYNLNEFNRIINKEKEEYKPNVDIGKETTISNPKEVQNKFHNSFSTRFFNGLALVDIIQGGKFMVEGVEEYFKKGTELRAARFGLGLGKLLPEEVRADLLIKVEAREKESMDKEIESLGKVDSWIATARIRDWLLNKDTAEYKKEAGLIFMLQKYGHLTAKKGLAEFKGKFLWYEAFGGRIGDKFFLEIQKEAEEDNKTFSEEYLMYKFVKKQCGSSGYNGIKRRTRLHKEYKKIWPTGIEEEIKTGHTDASDERTSRAMVDGGISEMEGGTIANAVGWFQKAIERGGSLEEMSEGFFTLLYSGAIYNLDQKVYLKIKALWDAEGMPIIMARFSSYKDDMILFNKTVLELSKKIGQEYPGEFPNIATEAEQLFNDAINQSGLEKDRIEKAQDFWKRYGTPLSRALNMNHHSDSSYSKTDKIIFLEKDENPIFKEYYDKTREFATENDNVFKKDFMVDSFGTLGIGGLNTNKITKKYLQVTQGGAIREGKAGNWVWKHIVEDINTIKNSDLALNHKKRYIKHIMRDVISGLLANQGVNITALSALNNNTGLIGNRLNKWNINIVRDFGDVSDDVVLDESNTDISKRLDKVVNKIMSGDSSNEHYETGFDTIIDPTKTKVANNIDYEGMNE